MNIKIMEQKLSDGSKVYDVVLIGDTVIRFPCVTKDDVDEFADKLYSAINDHSVEVATLDGYK